MAKKRTTEKTQRIPTRRQLSMWQQQASRQRIVLGAGIFVIVAVLLTVAVGWYASEYRPLHRTVIKVNDTEFNMNYYIDMLKYAGGQDPQNISLIAAGVIRGIEQNELVRQAALKLGISASQDEVRAGLIELGLPNTAAFRDLARNQTLTNKLLNEYFELQVPLFAAQRQVMAMMLESANEAAATRVRLENGESFSQLAEALSIDSTTKTLKGELGWHPREIIANMLPTAVVADYAFNAEAGVQSPPVYDKEITKPLGYWLIRALEVNAEDKDAHVEAMMLSSQQQANEIKARVEAGEDFAALAKEFSQLDGVDTNAGDLGIVNQGMRGDVFDKYVFSPGTQIGVVSQPLRDESAVTKGGYWLIKVTGKEDNRRIDSRDRDWLKGTAFDKWATQLFDDPANKVESLLEDAQKNFAIIRAMRG